MNNNKNYKTNLIYAGLIFAAWLVTYIVCQFVFEQRLGWDEVSYLSVAKGIAEDFDFSSRAYTIMGLLKHGYPTNLINFPVYSIYLAIFFKIFGASLQVAYFSTWFAALIVCILIYFIFLLISENSHKLAFLLSMAYLFSPGMIKNCDTALMEQCGNMLLCIFVYLILRDYVKGKFTYFTLLKLILSFLILWLYKSLYIGYFVGALVFIFLSYNHKITGKKITTNIPLPVFILLSYGIFAVLFYIFAKHIFLPVAPMMNFTSEQEYSQVYADFLGGYFNNLPKNLLGNIDYFFNIILRSYFIYPTARIPYTDETLVLSSYYVFVGVYFFLFFIMLILTFASWRKFTPAQKVFVGLTLGTILGFNLVFNVIFRTVHANIWRYNVYSLPLYLCYLGVILKTNYDYVKPFFQEHPRVTKTLLAFIFVFGYLPLFLSSISHYLYTEGVYHNIAHVNAEIVKSFIKDEKPKFIYYDDGTHTTWDFYPVRQIFKDAINEQLLQVNSILPEPIEYLFLNTGDWLFRNNQEQILMAEPILNGLYSFYGVEKDARIVVYKLNK